MTKPKKKSATMTKKRIGYRHLTPEIIQRLDDFLDFMGPDELRENLIELYHSYIIHQHDCLPNGFGKFAESMSVFFDLLKFAESEKS
jgi:hypothetical protein